MTLKKSILILILISLIPLLKGLDSSISRLFEYFLYNRSFNSSQVQIFEMLFTLGFAVGSLLGGIGIDLWNPKKLLTYSILAIVIPSGIIQILDINALIIIHRFILGAFLGFLMILLQVYLFEIAPTKHKGKFLIIFFLTGSIGGLGLYAYQSIFMADSNVADLKYVYSQLPYAVFPLLILFIIRQIPNKLYTDKLKYPDLKSVFLMNKKFILIILILLSIISVYGNAHMYFFVTSHLMFENNLESIWSITSYSGTFGSIISIFLIDSVGRKKLFLFGCKALILISFINSIVFLFLSNFYVIFGLVNLYFFLFSLAISMSVLIIILEYLPSGYRGRGLIIFSIISWIPNGLNKIYLNALSVEWKYTLSTSSIVIFGVLITGYLIIRKYLIDTKGLTLDEIESKIIDNKNNVA